jgi:squalene-associated FAD-dependent desaturase
MNDTPGLTHRRPRIAIIGGGLAGLSAAHSLAIAPKTFGLRPEITLFESRRTTGGRAGSFIDPKTGQCVDYCQHVAMGCCTNLIDLIDQCGLSDQWTRHRQLSFHHPAFPASPFKPSRWLPPPLHLLPTLGKLAYLSARQRREIRSGTVRLMRVRSESLRNVTAQTWLAAAGQSPATIRDYWDVVIVSALGETSQAVSMAAARHVFVDGFLAARGASDVLIPRRPLSELFGNQFPTAITNLGVTLRTQTAIRSIDYDADRSGTPGLIVHTVNTQQTFDHVIVAVPWHQVAKVVSESLSFAAGIRPGQWATVPTSPISGVHLWFDIPITAAPHAVMVGTMSQWLFPRPTEKSDAGHYYQVVISASRQVRKMSNQEVTDRIVEELGIAFPKTRAAKVLASRVVTDPQAVFSIRPEVDAIRPASSTALPCLHLAGDFVQTGWPATMEGAIISGRQAANSCLTAMRQPTVSIRDGLHKNWLTRQLIRP